MKSEKYITNLKWAVFNMIDRSTQDDHRSKVHVCGLFYEPTVAEDFFIPNLPNQEAKRYVLHVSLLERFEEFYNFIQDINGQYGEKAIYHLDEGNFFTDEEAYFRQILGIWTDTKIK